MEFEVISEIAGIELIASGRQIRDLERLRRSYGSGRWRKLKGFALIRMIRTGETRREELHWYEAHGIGKREVKIKFRAN